MRDNPLQRDFERLENWVEAHARGPMFEQLVKRLLARAGFSVVLNPGTARPRQTDLLASYKTDVYLVETKWQKDRVEVGDIDNLRARLARTQSHVTGVFISMSGYGDEAMREVEGRRERAILLVTGEEVRRLVGGEVGLRTLLRRKKEHLLVSGEVLLDATGDVWQYRPQPDLSSLPQPDVEIRDLEGRSLRWVSGAGHFGDLVYAIDLPDLDWGAAQDRGVGFDLWPPPIRVRSEVAYALDALRDVGWVTSAGRWAIHQQATSWFGAGAASFLAALEEYEERYAEAGQPTHHSEKAIYYDLCQGGCYALSVQLREAEEGWASYPHLSVRLPGIPLDAEPFERLARAFDLDDLAYFRPLGYESERSRCIRLAGERVELEPVGFLHRPWYDDEDAEGEIEGGRREEYIVGIIARNPFRGTRPRGSQGAHDDLLHGADAPELLVCDLRSWHEPGRAVDRYYVWSVQCIDLYGAPVLAPVAEWEDASLDAMTITLPEVLGKLTGIKHVEDPPGEKRNGVTGNAIDTGDSSR